MNVRTAAFLLRVLPRSEAAVTTVIRAAESGDPAAVRAFAGTARAFAGTAGTPLRETLWRAWLSRTSRGPGRWTSALLDGPPPAPGFLVDAAWADWLDEHDDHLWSLLKAWDRAATGADARVASLSRLARGDARAAAPRVLAEAAARLDHPIGDQARAHLLAHPEPDAVDALCDDATRSPELTAFCVAHRLAPSGPVERAAFFVRTGQHEQHRALDGDGALLATAYRAAPPDVRAELRTIMAEEGDSDLIRVTVTGERRGRIAELSGTELAYLRHHLAEQRRWPDLRALARDLPVAAAAETARLLPADERAGDDADLLAVLADLPWQKLRDTAGRLPADHLTRYGPPRNRMAVSISPDSAELAVSQPEKRRPSASAGAPTAIHVDTVQIGTGESTSQFTGTTAFGYHNPVLHLGDEILLSRKQNHRWNVERVFPGRHPFDSPAGMSPQMRRTSHGAVLIHLDGLAFADPGADGLRLESVHSFRKMMGGKAVALDSRCQLTTLPAARLIAFCDLHNQIYVTTEDASSVLRIPADHYTGTDWSISALSFLGPSTLAVHGHQRIGLELTQHTEIWEFPPPGDPHAAAPHRTAAHDGMVRDRWPVEEWEGSPIDPYFAHQLLTFSSLAPHFGGLDPGIPWLQASQEQTGSRRFLAMPLAGDMLVTAVGKMEHETLEVHSRFLPTARALLERPLLYSTPQDLQRARDLRSKIGDPAVRDALALLETCLAARFGGDIALGAPGPMPSAGPTDIALDLDPTRPG
ncbi:hypothetical protein [Actinomadura sp. 9N215]|uniref:hypothetical protein n=1 Tax=Actinomadura sp. 9N215 TaxID=3375150 RepID=UPI0037B56D80